MEPPLIIPPLPMRYIPRVEYTEETPLFVPVIPAFVRFAVAMALEALIANYINNVPLIVRIATFFIAAFFFAVIDQQRWLRFKSRRYFVYTVSAICLTYAAIWAVALLYFREPSPENPELNATEIKLAAALREKDIAITQRDEARRERGDTSPSQPIPPIPPSLKTDEIDARLDAWQAVETLLNDVDRLLTQQGDPIINNWQSANAEALRDRSANFLNDVSNQRNRLLQLITSYHDFSDLSVANTETLNRLSTFIQNLYSTVSQFPPNMTKDDFISSTKPYIGSIKREMASIRQWTEATRKVAEFSVQELTARRQSIK